MVAFLKVCDPVFCRVPGVPDFGIGLRCPTDLYGDYVWMTRSISRGLLKQGLLLPSGNYCEVHAPSSCRCLWIYHR